MEILKAEQVSYSYRTKYQTIQAVRGVTCSFETGKLYAIIGESRFFCAKSSPST